MMQNVRFGSKAPFRQVVGHFRSSPINGHRQTGSGGLKGANNRHADTIKLLHAVVLDRVSKDNFIEF